MKNKFFKNLNIIVLAIMSCFTFANSLTLNISDIDKFQIENNLNAKITNVISNFYMDNNFAVTSNVILLTSSNKSNSIKKSFGALELEGILPSVPQKSENAGISNIDDYKVQIKDITVWLDYELDMINAQQNIKKILFESIDWLKDCNDCLKFRSKQFSSTQDYNKPTKELNSFNTNNLATEDDIRILEDNISYLTEQIEKFETNDGDIKNQWMVDFLNRALQEEKELNANLSDQIIENAKNVIRRDSSIIMNTTMGQKEIAETAMKENSKIVSKVSDNQFENNRYMLIVLFVLIGIVVLLVLLSFFNKGPKTVYLKPKNNTKDINSEDSKHELENVKTIEQSSNNNQKMVEKVNQTNAYDDGSVIQSDLKTIKQSAVKMSVGQKQQASQILKDWLDSGAKDTAETNEQSEESN